MLLTFLPTSGFANPIELDYARAIREAQSSMVAEQLIKACFQANKTRTAGEDPNAEFMVACTMITRSCASEVPIPTVRASL